MNNLAQKVQRFLRPSCKNLGGIIVNRIGSQKTLELIKIIHLSENKVIVELNTSSKYKVGDSLSGEIVLAFGAADIAVQVISISDRKMNATIIDPSFDFLFLVGQIKMTEGEFPACEALKSNLSESPFMWRVATTDEDFQEVCKVRKRAYTGRAKEPIDEHLNAFLDHYDERSKTIMAFENQQIVGSFRIVYSKNDEKLEIEDYLSKPDDIPPNASLLELSRLCIDPDYKNRSQLLFGMLKWFLITLLEEERDLYLATAPQDLVQVYRSVGFEITNVTHNRDEIVGGEMMLLTLIKMDKTTLTRIFYP